MDAALSATLDLPAGGDPLAPILGFAYDLDAEGFEGCFEGMSPWMRDAVGLAILSRLEGMWPVWGWVSNHLPWAYKDAAGDALAAGLDQARHEAEALAKLTAPDLRRKRLTRLTFTLLKIGTGAEALLIRLHEENRRFSPPLLPADVNKLAIWCAQHGG